MDAYLERHPRDFLAVATPGAGKTTFALTLASWLLHHHVVQQVTVVAPTEHLKHQWAEAGARIVWADPKMAVVLVDVDPGKRWGFYARGAMMVSGSGVPAGCFDFSRA